MPPKLTIVVTGQQLGQEYPAHDIPAQGVDLLPVITTESRTPLSRVLRKYATKSQDIHKNPDCSFWSEPLLRHILSADRILAERRGLRGWEGAEAATCCLSLVWQCLQGNSATLKPMRLKIFAMLLLLDKENEIPNFDSISDSDLPIIQQRLDGEVRLCHKDSPTEELQCFANWKTSDKEYFAKEQWKVLIPYFALDKHQAIHYPLPDQAILPFCEWPDDEEPALKRPADVEGGFGTVRCVRIDPLSHGFAEVLKKLNVS